MMKIKVKTIEWKIDYEDENCIYGYFHPHIHFFTLEKYKGYWEIWSSIMYDECNIRDDVFEKKFKKLEKAKEYCMKLMERFHNLFFEC